MSSVVCTVRRVESVKPHPNADKLSIAVIGGWQCCVPKDRYKAGDLITYIPPDSVLPAELSDRFGVTAYLSNGRVRAIKLRGEPSFGLVVEPLGAEGENVAEQLGITKFQPPIRYSGGDMLPEHPMFARYTDIENMRHFTTVIADGEEVVVTEKIHGTNCRVGVITGRSACGTRRGESQRFAGSKTAARAETPGSLYWFPWSIPGVEAFVSRYLGDQVILFGEVYGKVQSLRYGIPGRIAYRAFDLMVDGKYLDYDTFNTVCDHHGVETAPLVYRGPFSLEKIRELSSGKSLVPGADHIREGVVVKPAIERTDPAIGRVILKYVSDEYLCGENDDQGE